MSRVPGELPDQPLRGKRILFFVGEIYEDLELWYPRLRMLEAGAEIVGAGPERRTKVSRQAQLSVCLGRGDQRGLG